MEISRSRRLEQVNLLHVSLATFSIVEDDFPLFIPGGAGPSNESASWMPRPPLGGDLRGLRQRCLFSAARLHGASAGWLRIASRPVEAGWEHPARPAAEIL